MRRLVIALFCLLLPWSALPWPAWAQAAVPAGDLAAARGVIQGQLRAFQADDGTAAFGFATPLLQEKFGGPANFMEMVRGAYDPVYRPSQVEFRDSALDGQAILQDLLVVDRRGQIFMAHYRLERQEDGSWKIGGVWLEPLADLST